MLTDIRGQRDRLGAMDAVLVVGDVGSSGSSDDYEIAAQFLDSVCDSIGCAPDQVVCVPGNHDIDWKAHTPLHDAVRFQLRHIDLNQLSNGLLRLLQTADGAEVVFAPLANYNNFALRYGCAIGASELIWRPKELDLDGFPLFIYGITSPWISDAHDWYDDDARRLVAGLFQFLQIGRPERGVHLAMCHHPMRWLRDVEEVSSWAACAHLYLTGHEHEAGIAISNDGRSVRIASGAVNPDRTETGWIPAYNVIELDTEDEQLMVRVHARSWQGRDTKRAEFGPDSVCAVAVFALPLRPADVRPEIIAPEGAPVEEGVTVPEPEPIKSDTRTMMYRVMRASPDERHAAARELGLLVPDEDLGWRDVDVVLLERAVARGLLPNLDQRLADGGRA